MGLIEYAGLSLISVEGRCFLTVILESAKDLLSMLDLSFLGPRVIPSGKAGRELTGISSLLFWSESSRVRANRLDKNRLVMILGCSLSTSIRLSLANFQYNIEMGSCACTSTVKPKSDGKRR